MTRLEESRRTLATKLFQPRMREIPNAISNLPVLAGTSTGTSTGMLYITMLVVSLDTLTTLTNLHEDVETTTLLRWLSAALL